MEQQQNEVECVNTTCESHTGTTCAMFALAVCSHAVSLTTLLGEPQEGEAGKEGERHFSGITFDLSIKILFKSFIEAISFGYRAQMVQDLTKVSGIRDMWFYVKYRMKAVLERMIAIFKLTFQVITVYSTFKSRYVYLGVMYLSISC